jgi:hypothetical protein
VSLRRAVAPCLDGSNDVQCSRPPAIVTFRAFDTDVGDRYQPMGDFVHKLSHLNAVEMHPQPVTVDLKVRARL